MGSSETGGGMVDCTVGSIVWVRRRNGSWWPGKILGPKELSASHLLSPRSGTPVKLLGREDASVDWYNLEKSKRVKAFRCGEFDDCIKRAEASQGIPPKKREKYARREDAILHALELERQFVEKKGGGGYSSTGKNNKSSGDFVGRESVTSLEHLANGNGRHIGPKSHKVSARSGFSLADKSELNSLSTERPKDGNELNEDVDDSKVLPRMRGLQDIALSTAPSEESEHWHPPLISSGTDQPVLDISVHDGSLDSEGLIKVEEKSILDKRKPSDVAFIEDGLVKRRDKRRHLAQLLQSSETFPVSLPQPDSVSNIGKELPRVAKNNRSRHLAVEPSNNFHHSQTEFPTSKPEDNKCEQDGSGSTEYTDTDLTESDSLESDTDDEMATLSDGAASIELEPKYVGRSEALADHGSVSSEEVDDGTSHRELVSAGFGVSKWKLKGKRNSRSLNKRPLDPSDGDIASRPSNMYVPMAGYGSRAPGRASRNMFGWGDYQPSFRGYWEEYIDPISSQRHVGVLVDVDLKVQSSYQREHVPMISLMSKINGQAIVGHPIQVEALANGSTETIFWETDETLDYDTTALQPSWRTARRTANGRTPRPPEGIKHERNVGKVTAGICLQKASKTNSRPPPERTFTKKPGKKVSLPSNQKIRTLSSIASLSSDSNIYQVDGALKQQETFPTVVACIPVKLVFSRLNEELVGRRQ